jgi:diguanylate cyclase (GGDEF)-like protein
MLARYGGDEFSVILPDCPLDEALAVVERLRDSTPAPLTCSAGVACTDGGEATEAVVRRADMALYDAKRNGRNKTQTAAYAGTGASGSRASAASMSDSENSGSSSSPDRYAS